MTFHEPTRRGPYLAIGAVVIVAIMSVVFFFSFKECGRSGILRSGKSSDATSLYQVFPVEMQGKNYLLSLEGVFKTRIYERSGGFTQRSGSTDVRLTLRDLSTGEQVNREVLGDYHEAFTKILGVGHDVIWMYNKKDGLHGIQLADFETKHTQDNIISGNRDLSEGIAMANDYLGNLEELYAYDKNSNSLMITTITGKRIFIDATNFSTVAAPNISVETRSLDDLISDITERAKMGEMPDMDAVYQEIMKSASDLTSFSDIGHTADRVMGIDSCTYSFDGKSVRTIVKSDCIIPVKKETGNNTAGKYISPVFLSEYNTELSKYINPTFLGNEKSIIFHSDKIGDKTNLIITLLNTKTLKSEYSVKTGIILNNHGSSYTITGSFNRGDTLFIGINNQLLSLDAKTGKIYWKTTISKDDYYSQLYYLGAAIQNGKTYFIAASSYFTKLSQDGFFVNGRTDYKINVIDAITGKELKKMEAIKGNSETLPYYLGMSDGKCWFYSRENSIHSRSLPDLKITDDSFSSLLKKAGVESPLVNTTRYDDAMEDKFIGMDTRHNTIYVTTQNGLHYAYNLLNKEIKEVEAPENKNYENWMSENSYVKFYRMRLQNMFQHDLLLQDGREISFEEKNSVATFKVKENKSDTEPKSTVLNSNQFIDAEFLTNGISLNNQFQFTGKGHSPLRLNNSEKSFYIWHHDKISPEAHQIITKYNYDNETINWKLDITTLLGIKAELIRIYTLNDKIYFVFKTHPDLDDNFVCVAINAETGKEDWMIKF